MNKETKDAVGSAKKLILQGEATCVLIKDGEIISTELAGGIKPVIAMYEKGLLEGAVVVDKIIGKAAASIMVLGGVRACFGMTMSRSAVGYLQKHGIEAEYEICVENIMNRAGDDICPMEKTVQNIESPSEAFTALKAKVKELQAHKA